MSADVVTFRDVSRVLRLPSGDSITPVRDATLTIAAGDRIVLTGPSGSGKTTFIHLCAALDVPTSGTVAWPALPDGPKVPGVIGVTFQTPSLIPWLSVEYNVAVPALAAGVERSEALARAAGSLASFGLGSLAGRLPDDLSGGQAQRVVLARALITRPALILADEPTGQLDGATAQRAIRTLLDMTATDTAILVATHDERLASTFATRWSMVAGTITTS